MLSRQANVIIYNKLYRQEAVCFEERKSKIDSAQKNASRLIARKRCFGTKT